MSGVTADASHERERVRVAEVVAALSLATDLGIGVPVEHGLHSTLFAMRLCERLGVEPQTASETYYACLLFYVGCTAGAEIAAELFGSDDALMRYAGPVRFGSRRELAAGFMRAVAPPGAPRPARAVQLVRGLPRAARALDSHVVAQCEVGQMLTDRLGVHASVRELFWYLTERWDGKGQPRRVKGEEIPLPVRIVHVARDAALQRMLGGDEFAARVVLDRAGGAFDPEIAERLAVEAGEILGLADDGSLWGRALACEPAPRLMLEGEAIDRALAAMGDFADLASSFLVGHSEGVAELAGAAAQHAGLAPPDVRATRRAGFVHDVGRVAIPVRIWQKPAPLTTDEWEQVRLHAYHSERVLLRSEFLARLAPIATAHHERLDGSGAAPGDGLQGRLAHPCLDGHRWRVGRQGHLERVGHRPHELHRRRQRPGRGGRGAGQRGTPQRGVQHV